MQISIQGIVQGVGFRPFIYKLASQLNINGFVLNSNSGVFIEIEGDSVSLQNFLTRLHSERPVHCEITNLEFSYLDIYGYKNFEIKESYCAGNDLTLILPDIATCKDCLNELYDPSNRRYLYPFINCTNCGPRLSIIHSLPYDRPNTSMKLFKMCDKCKEEYENPDNRRFHAQPISCYDCGPTLSLFNSASASLCNNLEVIKKAVQLIKEGNIVAIKGIGGFHLVVDATNEKAILRLRQRKSREEKPFALMFSNLNQVKQACAVDELEEKILCSVQSPIVLLKKKMNFLIAKSAAPSNPYLGAMLPYSPLHHLLMHELRTPIVATSGNLSEEPICYDEIEALNRLHGIADFFLVHNRPIVRPLDDSIIKIVMNRPMLLRRARGFAPLPIIKQINNSILSDKYGNLVALGAHQKNTISFIKNGNIFVSQHIGDLSTLEANLNFENVYNDYKNLYKIDNENVVCDLHPDYTATKFAKTNFQNHISVQHHIAHLASCKLENQVEGSALGVAWDGTGLGLDGTIWGGEFFLCDENSFKHLAQFRRFKLPGGDKAIKDIRRSTIGILFECYGDQLKSFEKIAGIRYSNKELKLFFNILQKNINCFTTSSVGRLFDAISYLLGIVEKSSFEGQAAMMLEYAADPCESSSYPFNFIADEEIIDWEPMLDKILEDIRVKKSPGTISGKFHNTLVEIILYMANYFRQEKVILSGGCFQNVLLLEKTIKKLQAEKIKVYWHQLVPTNDGGISFGQIAYVLSKSKKEINKQGNQNVFSNSR
ncbi:MAG: carbamoyltransferase HypF [Ignavibacteriales bacterium]|nr:carbamoyltransferase HypF [Ignavibacteriales bacterium]